MRANYEASVASVDGARIMKAYIDECCVPHGRKAQGVETFKSYIDRVCEHPIAKSIAAVRDLDTASIRCARYNENVTAL